MQLLRAEPLASRNTLALPATATALALVSNDQELSRSLEWARAEGLPALPLGQGSNVVFANDVDALLIRQLNEELRVIEETESRVLLRIGAGLDWHSLVSATLAKGYFGLENLALIPGTVGAAPVQNIGAYGVELEQFVSAVQGVHTRTGEHLMLTAKECGFAYRDSIFKTELRDSVIITAVDLALSRQAAAQTHYPALQEELASRGVKRITPQAVFEAVVAVRRRRLPDPAVEPNAGSFFKNPVISAAQADALAANWPAIPRYTQPDGAVKVPAAWLIEQAGWKGKRQGSVGVHADHALVLVHYGGGDGSHLLALAKDIKAAVKERFGIELEMEPRCYGGDA